jgi:hypothetical protein
MGKFVLFTTVVTQYYGGKTRMYLQSENNSEEYERID